MCVFSHWTDGGEAFQSAIWLPLHLIVICPSSSSSASGLDTESLGSCRTLGEGVAAMGRNLRRWMKGRVFRIGAPSKRQLENECQVIRIEALAWQLTDPSKASAFYALSITPDFRTLSPLQQSEINGSESVEINHGRRTGRGSSCVPIYVLKKLPLPVMPPDAVAH